MVYRTEMIVDNEAQGYEVLDTRAGDIVESLGGRVGTLMWLHGDIGGSLSPQQIAQWKGVKYEICKAIEPRC